MAARFILNVLFFSVALWHFPANGKNLPTDQLNSLLSNSDSAILDRELGIVKKTFHLAKAYNIAGRVNFKPWLSFEDATSSTASLEINPNFDDSSFNVELAADAHKVKNVDCVLKISALDANENEKLTSGNLTSDHCFWVKLRLEPGQWYKFSIFQSEKLIARFWQPIEPAFDADLLGITVLPFETIFEVMLDQDVLSPLWKPLIGQKGEIIVNLLDTGASTTISALEAKFPEFRTGFENLQVGHCYTVEMMSSVANILSFNRTWFHVRTSAPNYNLSLVSVEKEEAKIHLERDNTWSTDIDQSCSTILTVTRDDQLDFARFYFLPYGTVQSRLDGLSANTKYELTGATQCGDLTDLCRLQKTALNKLTFETTN